VRLKSLTPSDLDPDQRDLYDRINGPPRGGIYVDPDGSMQGPFNAMLHHPTIGDPLQRLGATLRYRGVLDARARELVILTVAASYRAEYEWYAHAPIAAGLGIDADVLEMIGRGERPALEDEVEQLAFDLAQTILERGDLDNEEWARMSACLSVPELFELTTLVGFYSTLAMQMRLFRVELPAGAVKRFS
jgi:4-carboxymuconolactone decarboxylase